MKQVNDCRFVFYFLNALCVDDFLNLNSLVLKAFEVAVPEVLLVENMVYCLFTIQGGFIVAVDYHALSNIVFACDTS
jgi:hypothetical protein